MVKKKLNLKNQEILLVEAFLVMPFSQNDSPKTMLKKVFSEKPNDKTFEEIKKFHWVTVPIMQENQNAAKKSSSHFYSLNIP